MNLRKRAGPLEPATTSHSTPLDHFPDWRCAEIARKYNDPHEWDVDLESDGEIDDVELEGTGTDEESL